MTELTVATQEEDLGIIMGSQLHEVVPNKHYLKRGKKKKRIGKKKINHRHRARVQFGTACSSGLLLITTQYRQRWHREGH